MTILRYLLSSLLFHWRTNLAVMLGTAAGAAVIGGALIVGDSVRASLQNLTLERLGQIDYALSGGRFFTQDLADRLPAATPAPALSMRGGLTHRVGDGLNRAGGVNVFGVDQRLWKLLERGEVSVPGPGEVVLNRRVANELGVKAGDSVDLNIEVPSAIPRESLLGERDDLSRELPLKVSAVLPDELGAGRFGLNPSQQIPPVAFLSLTDLQNVLGLAAVPASRRNPSAKPARVNSLYFAGQPGTAVSETAMAADLTQRLKQQLTLADLGLRIVTVPERGYVALESTRMILDTTIGNAAKQAATSRNATGNPVYVYLVNELANTANADAYAMYSVVAGIDFTNLKQPFGPFEYVAGGPPSAPNEIVLNEFVANEQLKVQVGDTIDLKYYSVGSHGELPEESRQFRVSGVAKLAGPAADRNLTPMLEGITDADSFGDWEQPFEMDLDRITAPDETYWDEYRATPKAFLPLEVAQNLFRSRYGKLTSYRIAVPAEQTLDEFASRYENELLKRMNVGELGLSVLPVKAQGLQAASGTTDFSGLFIGFSFFLILSAAILIGLLFRLGIERRVTDVGLLEAVGFSNTQVRRLFLAEGFCVVLAGSAIGLVAAVAYANAMIYGLTTWWVGAIGTRFLSLSVEWKSLTTGFVASLAIGNLATWWGLRRLRNVSPRALLAGSSESPQTVATGQRAATIALGAGITAAFLTSAGLLGLVPTAEAFGGFGWPVITFFLAGMLFLVSALAALAWWLGRDRSETMRTGVGLGLRNAARQRLRSIATVALVASATFVLVAVAASRRDPSAELPKRDSGNGGFLLVGESAVRVPFDLNTVAGREKLGIDVEPNSKDARLLAEMTAISFRTRPGDDASCLNLYRTGLPTVLGVPDALVERGGFKFIGADRENPWTLLGEVLPTTPLSKPVDSAVQKENRNVPTYPVLGDANTLMYSVKKGVGDTIAVPNEESPQYLLKVVGMLDGSVFQGALLLSEANFLRLYPEETGYGYFLVDGPASRQAELSNLLESTLTPYAFDVEPVADRIADFLAVQNTYLSTFQTLGGLGLLLGTIGLGTVMLRNVLERRAELALLRAVGFRNPQLALLVLLENALLLLWGLIVGTGAALLAVSPHLAGRGADVPVASGLVMLLAVVCVGMLAAGFAVRAAVRTPIVATLRGE